MSRCDVCGKMIKPWQAPIDFKLRTAVGGEVEIVAHADCASSTDTAAHMKAGHRRTNLCDVLGCTN